MPEDDALAVQENSTAGTISQTSGRTLEELHIQMAKTVDEINQVGYAPEYPQAQKYQTLIDKIEQLKLEATPFIRKEFAQRVAADNQQVIARLYQGMQFPDANASFLFSMIMDVNDTLSLARNPERMATASYNEIVIAEKNYSKAINEIDELNIPPPSSEIQNDMSVESLLTLVSENKQFLNACCIKNVPDARFMIFNVERAEMYLQQTIDPLICNAIQTYCQQVQKDLVARDPVNLYSPATSIEQYTEAMRAADFNTLFNNIEFQGLEDGPGTVYGLTREDVRTLLQDYHVPAALLYGIKSVEFIPTSQAPPITIYKPTEDRPIILDRGGDCEAILDNSHSELIQGSKICIYVREQNLFLPSFPLGVFVHELAHNYLRLAPIKYVNQWVDAVNTAGKGITDYAQLYFHDQVAFVHENVAESIEFYLLNPEQLFSGALYSNIYLEQYPTLLSPDERLRFELDLEELKTYSDVFDSEPFYLDEQ